MKSDSIKQFIALQKSLTQERDQIQARLEQLIAILGSPSDAQRGVVDGGGGGGGIPSPFAKEKRGMSAEGRAKIVAAQKARWAKYNAAKGSKVITARRVKRKMSVAGRAKIAAAARARWAKAKAAGKSSLAG
jgi:hypothetical protein